jgi:hypothetical protein
VIGSRPPWSQVARKLISPFPSPPHSKFPTPWGSPELNMRLTRTTSRIRLTRSGTNIHIRNCYFNSIFLQTRYLGSCWCSVNGYFTTYSTVFFLTAICQISIWFMVTYLNEYAYMY